jgi:hypothetical protein
VEFKELKVSSHFNWRNFKREPCNFSLQHNLPSPIACKQAFFTSNVNNIINGDSQHERGGRNQAKNTITIKERKENKQSGVVKGKPSQSHLHFIFIIIILLFTSS